MNENKDENFVKGIKLFLKRVDVSLIEKYLEMISVDVVCSGERVKKRNFGGKMSKKNSGIFLII